MKELPLLLILPVGRFDRGVVCMALPFCLVLLHGENPFLLNLAAGREASDQPWALQMQAVASAHQSPPSPRG